MSTHVQIRLPIPEGRPGETVKVSDHRAAALVRNGYAVVVGVQTGPEVVLEGVATGVAPPVVELPDEKALKAEWEEAAGALGIDVEGKTKAEIIAEVEAAVGHS